MTDEHVDIVLLAGHDGGQVSNHDVEVTDIIASVVAFSTTGLNGRNGDDSGRGRWNNCGSAVFENSAIASLVVR